MRSCPECWTGSASQRCGTKSMLLWPLNALRPSDPGDGAPMPDDEAIEAFLAANYAVSSEEQARLMRRIRHTRTAQLDTPWPVEPDQVQKLFLHLPTLFDGERSQRLWNLLDKCEAAPALVEHPSILGLTRAVLGADCVLSDCSATSIGPGTDDGGAWHVDVPLGQLPEPLPDFPLTTQNAWMLDDFTPDNGATRVVPGSHRWRRKPPWGGGPLGRRGRSHRTGWFGGDVVVQHVASLRS